MPAGYSGTPLTRKLSLKDGLRTRFEGMPPSVAREIAENGPSLHPVTEPPYDALHIFATERRALERRLHQARTEIAQTGFIWVSWPKRAAKTATDITEDTIREIALPLGLVDVKVCAVDATWSGLKLMIRKELRG
ncbi:DUF3052 family protein [Oceanibium sediminis]|uniref:DUF3052 family protein n=1 Tax=Oceanibium sediminis TaxID=2026339 RepID=UPI000DD40C29|nr:DUF3052 family protein [Oceanibium sediminis]